MFVLNVVMCLLRALDVYFSYHTIVTQHFFQVYVITFYPMW